MSTSNQSSVADRVKALVSPMTEKLNFDLVDVEFIKEYSEWYLRVYIDKFGGIGIDDCERLSRELSEALDREDLISQSYILEVSSPGLDRPLKTDADFLRYRGQLVEVKHRAEPTGKKMKITAGTLQGREDGKIRILSEKGEEIEIDCEETAIVKRAIRF